MLPHKLILKALPVLINRLKLILDVCCTTGKVLTWVNLLSYRRGKGSAPVRILSDLINGFCTVYPENRTIVRTIILIGSKDQFGKIDCCLPAAMPPKGQSFFRSGKWRCLIYIFSLMTFNGQKAYLRLFLIHRFSEFL